MSCELTCVLKLGDFLDRVFESLLFSYGDGKSVIQKLQKIADCFMYTYLTYKGYTRCLRCFSGRRYVMSESSQSTGTLWFSRHEFHYH